MVFAALSGASGALSRMQLLIVILVCAAVTALPTAEDASNAATTTTTTTAAAALDYCNCTTAGNGTTAAGESCTCGTVSSCVLVVGGCAVGGFVSFALWWPCCLLALGCRTVGILAGSVAACFQSCCGTPFFFRSAQSATMRQDIPCSCRVIFGLLGATVVGVAAFYLAPHCRGFEEVAATEINEAWSKIHKNWQEAAVEINEAWSKIHKNWQVAAPEINEAWSKIHKN